MAWANLIVNLFGAFFGSDSVSSCKSSSAVLGQDDSRLVDLASEARTRCRSQGG